MARATSRLIPVLIGAALLLGLQAIAPFSAWAKKEEYSFVPREMSLRNEATGQTDIYKTPDIQLMSKAFMKLSGPDLSDDVLVDDFASLNYCALINKYYSNEFIWKQMRDKVRQQIEKEMPTYPDNILLHGKIMIGRYDFEQKAFLLDDKSVMKNVGVFTLGMGGLNNKPCIFDHTRAIPSRYIVRLTNPIQLDAVELPEEKAAVLLKTLEQASTSSGPNVIRVVYVSFFIHINDFSLPKSKWDKDKAPEASVRSTLVALRLYEDQARSKMFYEYKTTD